MNYKTDHLMGTAGAVGIFPRTRSRFPAQHANVLHPSVFYCFYPRLSHVSSRNAAAASNRIQARPERGGYCLVSRPSRKRARASESLLLLPEVLGKKRCWVMAASSEAEVLVNSTEEEQALTAAEELAVQKREQRLRKFRELHLKRNEARKLNHQEVVEEDKRHKLPANWEAKKARLEQELQEEEKKKECAAKGEDYERMKLLEISAEDAERWERKKKRRNPDLGFSDYAAAQLRQYHRLTKQIKPDMETYERLRGKHGEEFYPTSNSLLHGTHVPSTEEVDRMVIDLEKQIEKRDKYSRRRPYNDDADIDYINERNAKFNKKAERFYGKYTAEIKQNLERGTAV
ncbi:pre-mRNA-splicing factor SYF2-like [Tamandua tetradactyla]|uniref:pre-mRNA-splicing factor SYF2-like n=1 Tax=Tamandua tetradactyla TaxID=48850 RepID=UPI0040542BCA